MTKPDLPFGTRDVVRETGRFGGWSLIVGIGVLIVVAILSVLVWGFGVLGSDTKGRGDAYKTKNSGENRIAAQEQFHTLYEDVIRADKSIDTFKQALTLNPNSVVAQTNYTGAITYCQSVVADYNASTEKYTQRDFRDADLPFKIDETDPATDCQETK